MQGPFLLAQGRADMFGWVIPQPLYGSCFALLRPLRKLLVGPLGRYHWMPSMILLIYDLLLRRSASSRAISTFPGRSSIVASKLCGYSTILMTGIIFGGAAPMRCHIARACVVQSIMCLLSIPDPHPTTTLTCIFIKIQGEDRPEQHRGLAAV